MTPEILRELERVDAAVADDLDEADRLDAIADQLDQRGDALERHELLAVRT